MHEDDRHLYYRDLLPLEASLVCGDAIGCVKDYPFIFEALDDQPIRQSFIKYPPTETKWIEEYLRGQAELGPLKPVTRADKDPVFVSSVVLVREGQSGQKFRLAPNLAEVNSRVTLPVQPIPDCQGLLDRLQGAKLLSTLDVKAAFNNIPLPTSLEKYCGIVTEHSLYVYTVMAWGFNAAPCHYQWVMNRIM